jgi:hypothetical protein
MKPNSRTTAKAQATANTHRAFRRYLATRRAYKTGRATIQQVARALALFDLAWAIAHLPPARRKPGAAK